MKLSTTLFLAFLLSSLGIYYFVSETSLRRERTALDPINILSLKEGDSLFALEIEKPKTKEKISLRRKGSEWMMDFPVSYPSENFLVEGMVDALTFSRRTRRLPFHEREAKEFGFDSPEIKITLRTEKEPRRRSLLLGGKSPVVPGVYAHWAGENDYFLIPSEVKASFERTVYSLRQKKLFRFNRDELLELGMKWEEKEFRLGKKGEKWRWTHPSLNQEIPVEKVLELVYAFQSLYVKEFLDGEDPSKQELGLQTGNAFLILKEKGGREKKLLLGASASRKEALYALRKEENLVLLISEKNLRSLFETFETTFLESLNESQRETLSGPGENRASRPPSPEKPG